MKVVASGKTNKFTYSLKLSDERLKLFIDISLLPPTPAESKPEDQKAEDSKEEQSTTAEVTAVPEPVSVSKEDIMAILPKEVWDGCLHHDVIDHIAKELSKGVKVEERRIAKGTEAVDGRDGRFILTVKKMSPKAEIHEDEKGFIDFKDLHRFENIRAGTIVAKIYPPKPGVPGTDPLGKTIPAKNGQASKLSFDQTLSVQDHSDGAGQDLVATVDGFLSDESGKLSIQQELKVSGSIDYKVGSIDFVGSVLIQGDVLPGFIVRGRKGVVIKGSVQEATISSSEGSVLISGHCMGSISSKIEAKTEISISVANQVEAQAGIIINILKEARDCQLRSGGTIVGKKAALIGGDFFCACGVEARAIGTKGGGPTSVSLSSDVAMTKEFAENQARINDHEKILVLLKAHLGPIAKTESGLSSLSAKHKERLQPILFKKRAVETSLMELRLKRDELLASAQMNHLFRINFLEKLYSGVKVTVGEDTFTVKDDVSGPKSLTYNAEAKTFEFGDIAALECSIIDDHKDKDNKDKKNDSKK